MKILVVKTCQTIGGCLNIIRYICKMDCNADIQNSGVWVFTLT